MAIALGTAPVFPCKCRDVPPFLLSWSFCLYRRTCPDLGGKEIFVGAQRQRIKEVRPLDQWAAKLLPSASPPQPHRRVAEAARGLPYPKTSPSVGWEMPSDTTGWLQVPCPGCACRNCFDCNFLPVHSYFAPFRNTWILSVQTTDTIEKKK